MLPNPRSAPQQYAAEVGAVAVRHGYRTALACTEGSLWALSNNRELLPDGGRFVLGLPNPDVVRRATSKADLLEAADDAGFAAPKTIACGSREQALTAADRLGYPVVVKPLRTVFRADRDARADGDARHVASSLAADPEDLGRRLGDVDWPCLLQRRETGSLASLGGVIVRGELLAFACSRYHRTWPPDAGPVCSSESIAAPATLLGQATRLATALGWEGIFELELVERGGGEYAVLDFNPRLYGSLALAVGAGAPLPVAWCDWLLKGTETRFSARPEIRYRWWDADLRYAVHLLSRGHFRKALSLLRPARRTVHPYMRLRDPLPMLARALEIALGLVASGSPRERLRRIFGG
jgi:predicted ATP-grasp superfamily ATP-dependent carboligase